MHARDGGACKSRAHATGLHICADVHVRGRTYIAFGGFMCTLWALGSEKVSHPCHKQTYPLLKKICMLKLFNWWAPKYRNPDFGSFSFSKVCFHPRFCSPKFLFLLIRQNPGAIWLYFPPFLRFTTHTTSILQDWFSGIWFTLLHKYKGLLT